MGHLGILLFVSPIQHRSPEIAAGLARAAAEGGHSTTIFFLGDGVYNTSRAMASAELSTVVTRFAELPASVQLINCSTCARFRGLLEGAILPNARNGTLEDLSELLSSADRFLTFAQEGAP